VLVEKQDLIIEVGVGTTSTTTTEIPPETTYVANPDPDAGTGDTQVVTPGVAGESTTTKAPGQEAVTEVTTPAVNEVIGVDNVDTTTQTIPY
ncbi:G5 domain-containing protein, partial [Klebsiella pneumoniae]|nr:G5 domain-containing protein [Klebsiella pneumoniae]